MSDVYRKFDISMQLTDDSIIETAIGYGWQPQIIDEENSIPGEASVMMSNPVSAFDYMKPFVKDHVVTALITMSNQAMENLLSAAKTDALAKLEAQTDVLTGNVAIVEVPVEVI